MNNFYDELERLEELQGTLNKEAQLMRILTRVKNAEAFFRFTFNDIKYGVQEQTFKNAFSVETNKHYEHISDWLPTTEFEPMANNIKYTVPELVEFGKILAKASGSKQESLISNFIRQCEPLKKKWFCRAILKDLRCGVGLKTVNSVFKELGLKEIPKFALQLCAKTKNFDLFANEDNVKKKVKFPCSMECKYDGIRLQAEVIGHNGESTKVILTSRRGTDRTNDYPEIVKALGDKFYGENILLDGEIISKSFQDLTRKDSTAMKKYVVFDLIVDETLPYINRWDNLVNLFSSKDITDFNGNKNIIYNDNHIVLAEHYSCNSIGEAQEYYNELNRRGEEGMILKNDRAPYVRGSRKHMFKFKKVYTADLKCYGFKYGEGKRSNKVATLCLQDKSKTINVDVGAGISDEMAQELTDSVYKDAEWDASFIGKITEIIYNEITETGSLRFPRCPRFRDDKEEPDDLSNSEVRQA